MGKTQLALAEKLRKGRVQAKTTKPKEEKMAKKEAPKKAGKARATFRTDVGQFGYLNLLEPNARGEFDKDKKTAQLMWGEEEYTMKRKDAEGKSYTVKGKLESAVLEVAKAHFENPKITLDDFDHPIKVGNDQKKPGIFKDKVFITAKRHVDQADPKFYGPKKSEGELAEKEVKAIKPGDFGRLVISIFGYTKGAGGVGFAFDVLQKQRSGPALTGGVEASASLLDDLEVELEDEDETEEEDTDSDEDDEEDEDDAEEDEEETAEEVDDDDDDDDDFKE